MHVSLISDMSIKDLTQGKDYTVTDRVVTLVAPTALKIKIYRQTTTKPIVRWMDTSVLRAKDMSVQEIQLLHILEENEDEMMDTSLQLSMQDKFLWDAKGKRLTNVADPLESQDAMTLKYFIESLKKVPIDEYTDKTFWELDVQGGIMPAAYPVYSKSFELDPYGDIRPVL